MSLAWSPQEADMEGLASIASPTSQISLSLVPPLHGVLNDAEGMLDAVDLKSRAPVERLLNSAVS